MKNLKKEHPGKEPQEGFATIEECQTYTQKKAEWWGSNLVVLNPREENGRFFPRYNIYD
jgi:hypothetical protein